MMCDSTYNPPHFLRNGVAMTAYTALWGGRNWQSTTLHPEPLYQKVIFTGGQGVPIFGWVAIPKNAHSTIVGTYGITGELDQQWFLRLLGRKAYAQGYAVVLFDWRAHGKTAELSPTLTSDGLYEGEDFVHIAAAAAAMGCPKKFWFTGYSLGGQLALWGLKAAVDLTRSGDLGIKESDIAGGAVICPSLDSLRSLTYLITTPFGKYVEPRIARELKNLAWKLHNTHPGYFDADAINRANSIWGFDQELVIARLGFDSVEAYYEASSGLHLLPKLSKPTLILYAADDPLFDPDIVPDLKAASSKNPAIDLLLTSYGGHVGYISSKKCQRQSQDSDQWWAWNRILQWIGDRHSNELEVLNAEC
ncbi:alpha/beta fold hydrolase [Anabaena cylindrica FACHB-243]|uniref:Alpha/beta hydrolase fold protein n=1 Tax=Anabaena cylindrica (strain ATCC 27899 / PCC 7122) TaxID=272123 RepID=K9ZKI3_ANACC|nr:MULTISPECIES: alpha/beta fold hydrolase [Anabaena]AFZ59696.1 alpha/beta hydrolase fold protein [Anabaena cylindrica PCC 7122]MBD2418642.1 alpha/beta fold hydrolase [Anabaena cylindrica FACHB-243]MBY5283385.1 alpha/beta fold hydrolase [Anabaena sp. CCAP 1446/1C]MBY5307760.1 alpha/beta fold hydrolase [Anabaena sp. CCAP 1446/1C]MCM2406204.1 alpha/beta fold hydrolase [Anabaena sp. CCAP 1446/1C]